MDPEELDDEVRLAAHAQVLPSSRSRGASRPTRTPTWPARRGSTTCFRRDAVHSRPTAPRQRTSSAGARGACSPTPARRSWGSRMAPRWDGPTNRRHLRLASGAARRRLAHRHAHGARDRLRGRPGPHPRGAERGRGAESGRLQRRRGRRHARAAALHGWRGRRGRVSWRAGYDRARRGRGRGLRRARGSRRERRDRRGPRARHRHERAARRGDGRGPVDGARWRSSGPRTRSEGAGGGGSRARCVGRRRSRHDLAHGPSDRRVRAPSWRDSGPGGADPASRERRAARFHRADGRTVARGARSGRRHGRDGRDAPAPR